MSGDANDLSEALSILIVARSEYPTNRNRSEDRARKRMRIGLRTRAWNA